MGIEELIDDLRRRIAHIQRRMTSAVAGPAGFTPWDEQIDSRSRVRATLETLSEDLGLVEERLMRSRD